MIGRSRKVLGALAVLTAVVPAAASSAADAPLDLCRTQAAAVRDALETRDDMRDEAYTAIMWARLDAEAALDAGDGAACVAHLDFPRRALGLHEESMPRP